VSPVLCAYLEITPDVRADHAAYIALMNALKDDKRLVFAAIVYAQCAADYLHSVQPVWAIEDSVAETERTAQATLPSVFAQMQMCRSAWKRSETI
jgi:antirestriction protein ArdC